MYETFSSLFATAFASAVSSITDDASSPKIVCRDAAGKHQQISAGSASASRTFCPALFPFPKAAVTSQQVIFALRHKITLEPIHPVHCRMRTRGSWLMSVLSIILSKRVEMKTAVNGSSVFLKSSDDRSCLYVNLPRSSGGNASSSGDAAPPCER